MAASRAGAQPAEEAAAQVWLISTRSVPTCGPIDVADVQLDYRRLGVDNQWLPADLEAILATDSPDVPTTVYIHGNRADPDKAIRESWPIYLCLKQHAAGRPFRFVIWSWPASRIQGGNLYDLRVKATRAEAQALYLAWYLDQSRPDVLFNLVGFSFGARVITDGLEILAGGEVCGYRLPQRKSAGRRPARAVLTAAALGNDWLLPGRRDGRFLGEVDRVLITINGCDRALRWHPLLCRPRGPRALGSTGPACPAGLGPAGLKIETLDVSAWVGKVHDWYSYVGDPSLCSLLPAYAFDGPPAPEAARKGPDRTGAGEAGPSRPPEQN